MPTFKQTSTWIEDGFGLVTDIFVVSDTYAGLMNLEAAQEVGVFELESTSHELELASGVFASDELTFSMDERRVRSTADDNAVDLVLAAQDPSRVRFCARIINPHTPVVPEDIEFVGRIRSEFTGEDKRWRGQPYSSVIAPVRSWKCSAASLDSGHILDIKLQDAVDLVESSWVRANVQDRLGYFRRSWGADAFGLREARWANLVSLSALLQKLLDVAATDEGSGISFTLVNSPTDLAVVPARFVPYVAANETSGSQFNGRALRYSFRLVDAGGNDVTARWPGAPWESQTWRWQPYVTVAGDVYPLTIGSANVADNGTLWVSWRLLTPTSDERPYSWLRYESLAELLYSIAGGFGMYVRFMPTGLTSYQVKMVRRQDLLGGAVYLRDGVEATIDLKLVDADKREQYDGASWQLSREGGTQYGYDGGFFSNERPTGQGELLPLTISPTWCLLSGTGEDARFPLGVYKNHALLPHNLYFWDSVSPTDPPHRKTPDIPEYNRAALHSAIYVACTGRSDDGSIGVSGAKVWAPAARALVTIDGQPQEFTTLAAYANAVAMRDDAYFEKEYEITVPGLCAFRSTPDGQSDWRMLKLGGQVTLDGITFAVVSIERKRRQTVVKLHNASRFALESSASYTPGVEPEGGLVEGAPSTAPRTVTIGRQAAGEDLVAFDVLAMRADGKLYKARAHHADYRRIVGLALHDVDLSVDPSAEVEYSAIGRLTLDGSFDLAPGRLLFLRTEDPKVGTRNLTQEPLTTPSDVEDMYVELGVAETANDIVFELGYELVYEPPIPDTPL